jgi:transposase
MENVTLIGIDLGKHSFHVHGQDRHGKALLRKKFSRTQLLEFFARFHRCTVVMEACAGAHCMARKLTSFGHEVKLISPQFVRPFVKSNKNDFVDAEAICDSRTRCSADSVFLDVGDLLVEVLEVGVSYRACTKFFIF